uniref:class I SAM-dependent DNA methyltransferase n=1 Tax=Thaumasiovibrio occultus TaxID=1891184 RepID=UPI000B35741D|nr:class I SAM-dependent methyltransferase [Thaumasiovibrio occultus]
MKSEMYSRYAEQYAAAIEDNAYNANFERPSLLALLDDVSGKSVLDLGCGPGVYAEILASRGAAVTAVDYAEEMVALTQDKLGDQVRAYQQDLAHGLPQETDATHDVVIAPLMLHYIADLQPLFTDIRRVLKPGGYFVFSTHHPVVEAEISPSGNYFQTELVEEEWDTVGAPVKVRFYRRSMTELFGYLHQAGFVVSRLTEGTPTETMAQTHPEVYQRLTTEPNFMFLRCE